MLRAPSGPTDHCSCVKDPGEWGHGGWHWILQDEPYCVKWADHRYVARYGYPINRDAVSWSELHEMARRYIGRPLAWKPCGHYVKAAEERARQKLAEKQTTTRMDVV